MNPWTTPGILGSAFGNSSNGVSIGGSVGKDTYWTPEGSTTIEQAKQPNKDDYSTWNGDWLGYMEYKAAQGDVEWQEKLFNYYMSEQSAQNARDWTAKREDEAVQRFVKDAKAGGMNPYALLASGGNPIASSSSGNSYSGSQLTTREHQENTEAQAWFKSLLSLIPMFVFMAAAAL